MKRYNFYKCRVEYGSSEELLKIVLVDNKFEYDSTILPVGEFDEHSSLTEFFSTRSVNVDGYSSEKFFDNLRKNIDEILGIKSDEIIISPFTKVISIKELDDIKTTNNYKSIKNYTVSIENQELHEMIKKKKVGLYNSDKSTPKRKCIFTPIP